MKVKINGYIKYMHKKGFTLAELLIVVAIIAVLVAVSIPIFTGRLEKARLAANEANIRSAKAAAIADWMDTARENGEEIDENLLAKLKELISADMFVYAGASKDDGGTSSSGGKYYPASSTVRVYGYKTGENDLFNPNTASPTVTGSGVYTEVFVQIDTENLTIKTKPYVQGGKTKVDKFDTNDFDNTSSGSGSGTGTGGSGTGGGSGQGGHSGGSIN
jgi:prepilin-type N-terminal cleavage/methylation domain-containing protein